MQYKKIEKITKEEGYLDLTRKERKDYLLEVLRKELLEEASEKNISFNKETDLINIIRELNKVKDTYSSRKEFNFGIIKSLLTVMGDIQDKSIAFIRVNDKYVKSPVYTYEDDKLVILKIYNRSDYLELLVWLINYLETKFLVNYDNEKTLRLQNK